MRVSQINKRMEELRTRRGQASPLGGGDAVAQAREENKLLRSALESKIEKDGLAELVA